MPQVVDRNESELLLTLRLANAADVPVEDVPYDDADLTVSWLNSSSSDWTDVVLAAGLSGTWVDGGWYELGGGVYRLGLPNEAIIPGDRTVIRVTYGTSPPLYDAIDAVAYNPASIDPATNECKIVVTNSETSSAIAGASVTVRDSSNVVIAAGPTDTSGVFPFGADEADDYSVFVSAGVTFGTGSETFDVSGNAEIPVSLTPIETGTSETDSTSNLTGPNYRVDTATDWEIPFVIGSLTGVTWTTILFTIKKSPTEQTDAQSVMQVKLTYGDDVSDGLVVLNGSSVGLTSEHAEIELIDTATGAGKVKIKAIATEQVASTRQEYWESNDKALENQRSWRTSSPLLPPVLHYDVKRLDGDGNASPRRAKGLLVVADAVTQNVDA